MDLVIKYISYLIIGYLSIRFIACFFKNYAETTESKKDDIIAGKIWNVVVSMGKAIKDIITFKKSIK